MTDLYDETDYFGTPESRDRDARFVGHEAGPDRLGGMSFDAAIPVLTALRKSLYSEGAKRNSEVIALNTVLHMIPRLRAETEGSAAIIAADRAEVLKLRAENHWLRTANKWLRTTVTGLRAARTRAALKGDKT